jgi:hypothetical protein
MDSGKLRDVKKQKSTWAPEEPNAIDIRESHPSKTAKGGAASDGRFRKGGPPRPS